MDLHAQKRRLRRTLLARRRGVDADAARTAAARVAERVIAAPEFRAARRLALYAPIGAELDTRPIFEAARRHGKGRLLPRIASGATLHFALIEDWSDLLAGSLGVPEPPRASPAVTLTGGDLVLLPGIAFDWSGHRLGRGGGHYDRTFGPEGRRGPTLFGLGFDFQLLAEIPTGPADRSVDVVITESTICRPGSGQIPAGSTG